MEKISLREVHYLPKVLEEGYLYVSEEFGIAGHLCACGCKSKVITPLEPTEWSIKIVDDKPSLDPSIGNWELPCKSHYWIIDGTIEWSYSWSEARIKEGRHSEEQRRKLFYESGTKVKKESLFRRLIRFIFGR
ncbi:MAG: DUF6527 family protein [Spirochaetales bacterium]|nr:DUF6527 family protein [Spirochaetales bacterium]